MKYTVHLCDDAYTQLKISIDMQFKSGRSFWGVVNHFPTPEFQLHEVHSQLITYQSKFAFFVLITIFVFKDSKLNSGQKCLTVWSLLSSYFLKQNKNVFKDNSVLQLDILKVVLVVTICCSFLAVVVNNFSCIA